MASNFLLPSKTSPLATTNVRRTLFTTFPSQCITFNTRQCLSQPMSATSSSSSIPRPSFNVDYLQSEFGSRGVTFTALGTSYVAKLVHDNGSAASILLPSGLITSYKPKMWHGSSVELFHTSVSEGSEGPVIQGGVSLALCIEGEDGVSWAPSSSWVLTDVKGTSEEFIQIEMVNRDSEKMVEVKHSITLKQDTLISEISVLNLRSSEIIRVTGFILSHLTVSTPEATYALGLERSNVFNRPPLATDFTILAPDMEKNQSWPFSSLKKLFPDKEEKIESEKEIDGEEEEDSFMQLNQEMSKIYTSAPRTFTIIDRGKRNSVSVGRKGFEELYIYSPGSTHDSYGNYSYICVGQSAVLKPIILSPQQQWKGEQRLHNPNF